MLSLSLYIYFFYTLMVSMRALATANNTTLLYAPTLTTLTHKHNVQIQQHTTRVHSLSATTLLNTVAKLMI